MNMYADLLYELHQNEILEEMERNRLLKEAVKSETLWDKVPALLGKWMVSVGKELRQCFLDAIQESFSATCREN